jgi:hypothetical protein
MCGVCSDSSMGRVASAIASLQTFLYLYYIKAPVSMFLQITPHIYFKLTCCTSVRSAQPISTSQNTPPHIYAQMAARHGPKLWPRNGMRAYWLCRAGLLARRTIWLNQRKMFKKRWRRLGSNPRPDGRRVEDTGWSRLTSRTLWSGVFYIEYKLYIFIYVSL